MTILAFIALAVYQNTAQSFALRDKLEMDGDFYSSLRVVMDTISRDISHIYTPQASALPGKIGKSTNLNLANAAAQAAGQQPGQQQGQQNAENSSLFYPVVVEVGNVLEYWGEALNLQGVRNSRLQGEKEKISFIANSHIRAYKDSAESDFAKIKYELEKDNLSEKNAKSLVKREDTDVFFDNLKSETEIRYTLLTNVKGLKFRYLDGEKDTWYDKWDTTSTDRKGVFPSVIEVELEVFYPRSENTFKLTQNFKPEMPL